MSFLLYKCADEAVFDYSPKIPDHSPKISEDFPKLFRRLDEHFPNISEDYQRWLKIAEGDRRCFDHTPTNFSVVEETREKCYQT